MKPNTKATRKQIDMVYSRVSTPFQCDNSTGSNKDQKALHPWLIESVTDPETGVDFDDIGITGRYWVERDDFEHLKEAILQGKVPAVKRLV